MPAPARRLLELLTILLVGFAITAPAGPQYAGAVQPDPNLTINDVSVNEGNAGTTSFTFTVSLSAPANPGGVTFDIATADNTATQPVDYTQKSLTSQTIPAGSSTYSFTVLVNGDTTPETNETFFVNVTNVTGATVTDGQGQGTIVNDDAAPNLTINDVSLNEGNAGTTTFTFTVSLSAPAPAGGVTFDIATADGGATQPSDYTQKSLTGQTIPAGSSTYSFTVLINGDATPETNETFFVNVTNLTNAIVTDGQGQGTIVNDDITKIHDVQGNGAATPIPGATVTVEGVVIANFQGANKLQGFFLEEEDADHDADPATSEGIFIFCSSCTTAVAEGQRVQATGVVSEFNNLTEITASAAGSVVITNAGNNLAQVTPSVIDLPIAGDIDSFYEAREGMKVTFVDTLTVADTSGLARFGQLVLFEGGRPHAFTEGNTPSVAGQAAHADNLSRRSVVLDDDNNAQEAYLTTSSPPGPADGLQAVYYPRANGGFSVGTQGTDFFRSGDLVNGLTGVLDWSSPGAGASTWRVRPTAANPATFTVANPRPTTPPSVGGAVQVAQMSLFNYFTTIDTTASNVTGPCGPSGTDDCPGADSVAELNRQRERASVVACALNASAVAFTELENTTPSASITDVLGAINTRCGGAHPYAFANTGGTLGTDVIRVQLIYRTGIVSPVGSPLADLDPVHNRPPTAQTFDVVDATNAAFGQRFTVIATHFKSKGGCPGSGADADQSDGQSCWNATRTAQANRLLTWINGTVIPAAGDPDVVVLGEFNAYAKEDPIATLASGGYADLQSLLHTGTGYSFAVNGQIGHLDYALSSTSMTPQIIGADAWHINADEVDLLDYNDEIRDSPGEATFEEKPDGSALVPPRVVFQPGTPYRAADRDPLLVGLFQAADLAITKVDTPDPVTAGNNLTWTLTVTNNGPDAAASASLSDTLPAGTTFVSLAAPGGWSCSTPSVGAGGTVSCTHQSFAVGSAVFTLTAAVSPTVSSGTVLSNTATITASTSDGAAGNNSATASTTVATSADLSVTKTDAPDPVVAGANLTWTISATNNGPSAAVNASLSDILPAGMTFVSLLSPGGWTCTTPVVGSGGTVACSNSSFAVGTAVFTLVAGVDPATVLGTTISNSASIAAATTDPDPGNNSHTASTSVSTLADLGITKVDTPDPVIAGNNLSYTITASNVGPSAGASASVADTLPAGTTFVSLASPGGWSCTTPAVGSGGPVSCSKSSFAPGSAVFTLTVAVAAALPSGTLSNTASVTSTTPDSVPGNNSATATTTVRGIQPATIAKAFGAASVPVNGTTTLTFTLTNPGTNPVTITGLGFSDPLPAGLIVSTPNGLTAPTGCGSPVITAVTGSGTITMTGGSIVAGGSCSFSVNVTATTSGVKVNTTGAVSSSPGGTGGTATASLTVQTAAQATLALKAQVDTSGAATAPRLDVYLNSAASYLTLGTPIMKSAACQQLKLFEAAVTTAMRTDPVVAPLGAGWIAQAEAIRGSIPCLPPN